jgi:hypothetical protein
MTREAEERLMGGSQDIDCFDLLSIRCRGQQTYCHAENPEHLTGISANAI